MAGLDNQNQMKLGSTVSSDHSTSLFRLDQCHYSYPGSKNPIIDGLTFVPNPQGITVILGGSGCGKTTLLHQLAKTTRVSMMFQEPRLLPWCTIRENLEFVLDSQSLTKSPRRSKDTPRDRDSAQSPVGAPSIDELLQMVGLAGLADRYPSQLSGGQKQRVSMARAFGFDSDALLMDEPFQGLDVMLRQDLIQLVVELWETWQGRKPRPIVAVIHEPRDAAILATNIWVFSGPPLRPIAQIPGNSKGPGLQDHETLEIEETILATMAEARESRNLGS
jgi:NitT/TauT family transport system ATP-binding protein